MKGLLKKIEVFNKKTVKVMLALAMILSLMPGLRTAVYAAEHPDWPTEVHANCAHPGVEHFYASGDTYVGNVNTGDIAYEGRDFEPGEAYEDFDSDNSSYMDPDYFSEVSEGWYYWDENDTMYNPCNSSLHNHSWAYAADGATLHAYCTSEDGCDYQGSATDLSKAVTLTLTKAFTDSNYNGLPNTAIFDYDEADAWEAATGESAPTITYEAKNGSVLTDFEGEMCAVKIGSYTAKATVGNATATLDFEVTRKEHSEVVDKVIDFDDTKWTYCFYVDGTYTSDVTGDTVGDVSSLRFYNISDEMVSYVAPIPLGKTLIGGHSEKVDIATISVLTSRTQNAVGIKCEYIATAHTLTITPINAAVIHKDTNDFEVTSDSVSKTFTQGQTSASTIHIAGLKIDNMNKEGDVYKGILVMNGETVLVQGTDYTVTEGSVKVNLTKTYLDKLPVGTHNIKVYVKHNDVATATDKDYEFDASVIINAKSNPTPEPEPTPETPSRPIYKAPNTGVR